MYYMLTSRSLTYAQRSARVLERAGITGSVRRVPRSLSEKGCSYSVIVAPKNKDRALEVLSAAGLRPVRVYLRRPDGTAEEVSA